MIREFEHIESVVTKLIEEQKQDIAFPLLDFYFGRCMTITDFEFIGRLALKHTYPELAVKCAERTHALSYTPEELYISRSNLYKAYHSANEPEKALFYARLNLEKTPNDFETILSYAEYLKSNGQRSESERIIEKLNQRDDLTEKQRETLWTSDTHKTLRSGQTALGIKKYLHTDKDKTTVFDIRGMKRWNGVIVPGSKIYVNAEGGIGDAIVNIRFFDTLKRYGMEPILFSNLDRPDIDAVFRRNGYKVITQEFLIEKNVPWEYMMQLPVSLNVTEKDLWAGQYLRAKHDPKNDLGPKKEFRVGIKCNGNQYFARDAYRSIPIDDIINSLPMNTELYYIDTERTDDRTFNLKNQIQSWDDTLDFIGQMDLIISSCTSVAHASGAMGVPTIVYVPILEYYVWTSSRTDNSTPWYGENFHIFKQTKPKSWTEPIESSRELINRIVNDYYRMEKS
jgi:tetratricopeptide (TPR) repeat protein